MGRAASTISREVGRHRRRDGGYSATHAQQQAFAAASRPQPLKLGADTVHLRLRQRVVADLAAGLSPEQVSGRLRTEFGSDPAEQGMRVHHETIYRALYLQARGGLKREVEAAQQAQRDTAQAGGQLPCSATRTNKTVRAPRTVKPATGRGRIPGMVSIRDRPPDPRHRRGLVPRPPRRRPDRRRRVEVGDRDHGRTLHRLPVAAAPTARTHRCRGRRRVDREARRLAAAPEAVPDLGSGKEMSLHTQISVDADIKIFFADPHAPWQRPGNENINGLLRQYFPKGTDLSVHSSNDLDYVEELLNNRPRARFAYAKPNELMNELLLR